MNERDIFMEILERNAAANPSAFLDEHCGSDAQLRRRVEELLAEHDREGSFILDALPPGLEAAAGHTAIAERPGSVIGPYKLLEQIGEGGFGVVFLAEQERPVRRRVALKIIKPGMDTRQIIARFEAERQAVAMMDHPNIAKVLEAGTVGQALPDTSANSHIRQAQPDLLPRGAGLGTGKEGRAPSDASPQSPVPSPHLGRPYFVMELVQGVPITDYCDQCSLTTRERLELFITVCEAVQHAHQKGVIHRDLKPTNVLVAMQDGKPAPKIIDFGVAKALNQRLTEHTLATGYAQMIGTPLYMSPEQAELSPLGADTRSDIYSLGVLLYELLTGTTPFDKDRLHSVSYDEMRRIIREEEPPRPSVRFSTLAADLATTVAEHRRSQPRRLVQTIHGELDWIVMKCLEKDRSRRYESASDLVRDIIRYIHDEPIQACPPSPLYRVGKFAQRNKVWFLTGSLIIAALLAGFVATAWQAIRATKAEHLAARERDRAVELAKRADQASERASREAAIAAAVNEFLQRDVLRTASPNSEPEREIKLRTVLDRASEKIQGRFPNEPLVEAAVHQTIGCTYMELGEIEKAKQHLKRAWELHRRELGPEDAQTLRVAARLASFQAESAYAAASANGSNGLELFAETLALQRQVLGEEHPDTMATMASYARALDSQDRPAEAIVFMGRALPWMRRSWGSTDARTLAAMNNMANILRKIGRRHEALRLYEEGFEAARMVHGSEHPRTLRFEDNIAISLRGLGLPGAAMARRVHVIDVRRRLLGEAHFDTNFSVFGLLSDIEKLNLDSHGKVPAAVDIAHELTIATPESGGAWTALGMARHLSGDAKLAVQAFEKSITLRESATGVDWFFMSMLHSRLGNMDAAKTFYDQANKWLDANQPQPIEFRELRRRAHRKLAMALQPEDMPQKGAGDADDAAPTSAEYVDLHKESVEVNVPASLSIQ